MGTTSKKQLKLQKFSTGATRNPAKDYDPEGFLSPLAIDAFCTYMTYHRQLADGSLRDSDNWQKGIPQASFVKSLWRHMLDVWRWHRNFSVKENIVWALCGVIFNASGLLHELLKADDFLLEESLAEMEERRAAGT